MWQIPQRQWRCQEAHMDSPGVRDPSGLGPRLQVGGQAGTGRWWTLPGSQKATRGPCALLASSQHGPPGPSMRLLRDGELVKACPPEPRGMASAACFPSCGPVLFHALLQNSTGKPPHRDVSHTELARTDAPTQAAVKDQKHRASETQQCTCVHACQHCALTAVEDSPETLSETLT